MKSRTFAFFGKILIMILAAACLAAGPSRAQDPAKEQGSPWSGEVEAGALLTTGNTETESLNAGLDITRESPRWRHNLALRTFYSSETSADTGQEETTAQKWTVSAKTNYRFDPANSAFLLGLYEDDRFSGYTYQVTTAAGYSREFIRTDRMELTGEIGPGFRISKTSDPESDQEESEAILRMAAAFAWHISQTATFMEEISVEAGQHRSITRSTTSLKSRIAGSLAMKAAFSLKYTDTVPADTEKTDTETALTLVYDF